MTITNTFFNKLIVMSDEDFKNWKEAEQPNSALLDMITIKREMEKTKN